MLLNRTHVFRCFNLLDPKEVSKMFTEYQRLYAGIGVGGDEKKFANDVVSLLMGEVLYRQIYVPPRSGELWIAALDGYKKLKDFVVEPITVLVHKGLSNAHLEPELIQREAKAYVMPDGKRWVRGADVYNY